MDTLTNVAMGECRAIRDGETIKLKSPLRKELQGIGPGSIIIGVNRLGQSIAVEVVTAHQSRSLGLRDGDLSGPWRWDLTVKRPEVQA